MGGTIYNTHTLEPSRKCVLILREVRNLIQAPYAFCYLFCQICLSIPGAHFQYINSHQELIPVNLFLFIVVKKYLLFLYYYCGIWGVFFHCLCLSFCIILQTNGIQLQAWQLVMILQLARLVRIRKVKKDRR